MFKFICLPIVVSIMFLFNESNAQCTTQASNPSATVSGSSPCGGCTNNIAAGTTATVNMTSSVSDVYCVPVAQTSTITTLNWTRGTLRVCGTLTVTTLAIGFPSGTTDFARIVVEAGGTLNFDNSFSLQQYTGISNSGTLNFNNTGSVITLNNDAYIITATKTAVTSFLGGITSNSTSNLINKGTNIISGTAIINSGVGSWCMEKSFTTVVDFSNFQTNGVVIGAGVTANDVVINYTGTQNYTADLSGSAIQVCRNSAGSATPIANSGSAIVSSTVCSSPLPVLFGKFYASNKSDGNDVFWETSQEFNNDHFDLERSHDGINFEKITEVKGQGTKTSTTSYLYNDTEVDALSPVYYRLKQVDVEGKFEYSNVIFLNGAEGNSAIEIFPNPLEVGTTLNARFGKEDEGKATVSLFDLSGKLIHDYLMEHVQSGGIYAIEDKNLLLVKGTYLLQIKTLQHVYNQKIVVN
ncbi:MAG: hypothetical protein RL060_569 [Bacteroidota bacterium]